VINKNITIVESELKSGAKGEYLLIVDHEGVRFACFNQHKGLWDCLGKNMTASIGFEVKGIFKNIEEAHPISGQIQVDKSKITEQQVKPTPAPKPESKNRAFALSYAKDIACAKIQMGSDISPVTILGVAELFTTYLDTGYPKEAIKIYAQIQKELKKED